ncbi:MAG: LysM peptidoglycan-binding domain-containing protein [Polaribacter sp.]|nr:LysM peptidoglycan-binding domain-containing protein [Polaribacter sp.]
MKHLKTLIILFVLTFTVSCGQQKKYVSYTVKQGETIRSIAKKLDMRTRDLLRLNPDVGRKPQADTEIIVPKTATLTNVTKKEVAEIVTNPIEEETLALDSIADLKDKYVLHTLHKGDTFYGLTRYYNVLKADLLTLNPSLIDGLKLGAVIKIKERFAGEGLNLIYKDTIADNRFIKIGLLLPFRAQLFDTIAPQEIFKNDRLTNIVTDLYLGATLAIDSLRKQGVQVQLTVFDTEDRNTKINELIYENSLEEMDAIVGPLYREEAKKIANSVSMPVVLPIFSKVQTSFTSPRIVKTSPDKKRYKEALLSHIFKSYTNQNIIIVGDSTEVSMAEIKQVSSVLKQHDSIDTVHSIIPHHGYIAQERFLQLLKSDTTAINNWVIIATKNSVIASNALNSLISFPEPEEAEEGEEQKEKINYQVKVFAFEKGKTFAKVDNNKLAQLGFVYVTDTFVDEASIAANTFNKQYLAKNKALPSYDATRGFDVMYDVVARLASGKDLYDTYKEGTSYRLESKFDFQKRQFSITENNGLFLLEYNSDLSLKRLK